jgi:hypothetical protein
MIKYSYFISDHENRCLQKMVSCLAADIKCIWTGKPKEMMEHSLICPFEKIRPIIQDLRSELLVLNKTINELATQNWEQRQ